MSSKHNIETVAIGAQVVSGPTELVPTAVEAVKQWKYQPYVLGGETVEVESTADVGFIR